jgi:hypothetical protein
VPEYYRELFERYRTRGLLLDSNLLLLHIVGSHDERLIESFKRTRVFTLDDFRLLVRILTFFERVVTTPHILTEVNGLSNQISGDIRYKYFETFGAELMTLDEQFVASTVLAEGSTFRVFGLTDTAIKRVASGEALVLSVDLDLVVHLQNSGIDAINFNNIRTLGWSSG